MRGQLSIPNFSKSSGIQDFFETYPDPESAKKALWELLIAAIGSEHADMWDKTKRAQMLFFYEQCGDFFDEIYEKYGVT